MRAIKNFIALSIRDFALVIILPLIHFIRKTEFQVSSILNISQQAVYVAFIILNSIIASIIILVLAIKQIGKQTTRTHVK